MALQLADTAGRVPYYEGDTTRSWVEAFRKNGLVKPQLVLRFATDTNYLRNAERTLYNNPYSRKDALTRAIMNITLPGMRVPGVLNWQVNESIDQITQTASFEAINCLPISEIETQLTSTLQGLAHDSTITASWVSNSLFVVDQVTGVGGRDGNNNVELYKDPDGYPYREFNTKYRTFAHQGFFVTAGGGAKFPDPAIPNDDDNDIPLSAEFPTSSSGAGSYFLLIDNEVVRVVRKTGDAFFIPAGGRGVNGIVEAHAPGARIRLLGYGGGSGEWCAMGYLNIDDVNPQTSILRPGTCITSYEGYGDITGPLSHTYDENRNYQFTGYWFITAVEPSLGEDGIPKVKVDLKGTGYMFEKQKITPDLLRRIKNKFGQWTVGGKTIWGAAGHNREIPGDWVDYNSWDPSLARSYPLKIKTEFAQHKEFADHMVETEFGTKCELCREEHAEWIKLHGKGNGKLAFVEDRAIGRHIYKESIRVLQAEAGPIKTYIRLMATIAAASWDHPAYGTELSQKFTKIPSRLYDNIRNLSTGLVYNGQIVFEPVSTDPDEDWFTPTYDDTEIISKRAALTCPFEATYDQASFSQPMIDVADMNGNTFWVTREGYPVFKPKNMSMRPSGAGYKDLGKTSKYNKQRSQWFMAYGSTISSYSLNINSENIITQCWVDVKTAFDTEMTVLTGGSGYNKKGKVLYSALGGNREGLAITSGTQQPTTQSVDNMLLGLDWNTEAGWGVKQVDSAGNKIVAIAPHFYEGSDTISKGSTRSTSVRRIQQTINFFLVRKYLRPLRVGNEWALKIDVDGKFGEETKQGVIEFQKFLNAQLQDTPKVTEDGSYRQSNTTRGKKWISTHEHYVKADIFWYVANNRNTAWESYVAAVTGVPIVMKTAMNSTDEDFDYVPDQKNTNEEREAWTKTFAKSVINLGARVVDDSINQATVRSISVNMADPRVQPGDTIWAEIPGFLTSRDINGENKPPFTNGIYVTTLSRQMDLQSGSYTGTVSGYRHRGVDEPVNGAYDFID